MAHYDLHSIGHAPGYADERLLGLIMTPHTKTALTICGATAALAAVALLILYYYSHDPSSTPSPKCMFKTLTGWDCPGCGSQRALHAALHGDFVAAWHFNPFVFFAVPAATFYIIAETGRRHWPRLHAAAVNPLIIAAIAAGSLLYMVLRNIL